MKRMMLVIVSVLLSLPLMSVAPLPKTEVEHYSLTMMVRTSAQACTYELAPARLRQQITDSAGLPYGMVEAFSCSGNDADVAKEFIERTGAMQAEANAYRAAHPIR